MRPLLIACMLLTFSSRFAAAQPTPAQPAPPAPLEAQRLERGKTIERTLGPNETHVYTIPLAVGQFLQAVAVQHGVDVAVRVFAPDGSKIADIDSPNGVQGDEPINLEAKTTGTYRIEVVFNGEAGGTAGRYDLRVLALLSPQENAARLVEIRRKQQAVVAWLKRNAVPIQTVEAGNGFKDLQPLKKVFKDVRFVGLGEATHGTREFFQFKHRMLEFLVREMGFRVFAIEGSYAALQNIDDYIQGKTSDGTRALDSQGFWTWNTTEVRAMMDWARAYNQSVPPGKRVEFVGFDIQFNQPGKDKLLDYLKRVAPERSAPTTTFFAQNLDELNTATPDREKAQAALEKLKALQASYNDLSVFLDLNGTRLVDKSSPTEYAQMREYARVLTQYVASYNAAPGDGVVARDLYMTDNLRRLVEQRPAGTRFVLWAHNGHIQTDNDGGAYPTFGYRLRRFYGSRYYAVGFAFNQGGFQARDLGAQGTMALTGFALPPARPESIEWSLAQTGLKTLFVDLRGRTQNADLRDWLDRPNSMRLVGSAFSRAQSESIYGPVVLRNSYDGLFFLDTTTRAHPNPSVKNVAP